jgi:hypothetical protein
LRVFHVTRRVFVAGFFRVTVTVARSPSATVTGAEVLPFGTAVDDVSTTATVAPATSAVLAATAAARVSFVMPTR